MITPESLSRVVAEARHWLRLRDGQRHTMIPNNIASTSRTANRAITFWCPCRSARATYNRRTHCRRHIEVAHRHGGDGSAASSAVLTKLSAKLRISRETGGNPVMLIATTTFCTDPSARLPKKNRRDRHYSVHHPHDDGIERAYEA